MESGEKKQYILSDFRDEIANFAQKELREKQTAHFGGEAIKSDELTEEDMKIWIKIKDGSVTEEDAKQYRHYYDKTNGQQSKARFGFFSLAINYANGIIGQRWWDKEQKKKRSK